MLVLAGYIAPTQEWRSFSIEWQRLLEMGPPHHLRLDAFKMQERRADMERCGWFYRVIEEHVTAAVSCTISIGGLEKAVREFPWPFKLENREALENPYYFGFKAITDMLAQHQYQLRIAEPVNFIFDDAFEKKHCLAAWDRLKQYSRPEVSALMGDTPSFETDDACLPLQAADLYAYWVREWEINGIADGLANLRFGWNHQDWRQIPRIDFKFQEEDFVREFQKIFDPEVQRRIGVVPAEAISTHLSSTWSTSGWTGARLADQENDT